MQITVNSTPLELYNGAKVKDAILKYYSQLGKNPKKNLRIEDSYGNSVDFDGALTDGNSLFIKTTQKNKTLILKIIVALITLLLLFSCSSKKKTVTANNVEKEAVIFAVNDMHASVDNFPKLAFIVDSLRTIYPNLILVAAGDNQTGNPVNDQYFEKGYPVIDLMNSVGFNLSAVGNHEFDSHLEGFSKLSQKANFDFICANFSDNNLYPIKVSPYKIITLPNGLKLAFLGLLQINQNGIPDTHPDNVKGFTFSAPFETAPKYLYLKDESDIFIALTHLGFESDVKLAKTMKPGIDIIIGGHSHTKVDKEQIHNGILITQAENKLKYGTLINIKVLKNGDLYKSMKLIDIKNSKSEKPSTRALVDKYNDNVTLKTVISTATDNFSSYEELGYLMADAQRNAAKADIALVNPGGVRIDHLAKGPITILNVYQLDPFGNELVITKLTGKEIQSLMLEAFEVDEKLPLYPSGIKTKLILDENNNLKDVQLKTEKGASLDLNKTYKVAMNNYMTSVYKYKHKDPGQSLFIGTAESTIEYLKNIKNVKSYKGEKRIEIN